MVWVQEVMRLGPTMYFGELALLRGEPRAATVAALTDTSVLMLAREDFNILLGPLQLLLGQNAALYGPTATGPGVKQASKRVFVTSAAEEHEKADQGYGHRRQLCMPLGCHRHLCTVRHLRQILRIPNTHSQSNCCSWADILHHSRLGITLC